MQANMDHAHGRVDAVKYSLCLYAFLYVHGHDCSSSDFD